MSKAQKKFQEVVPVEIPSTRALRTFKLAKEPEKQGPQVKLIIAALKKLGTTDTRTLTAAVGSQLATRQDPLKVVSFYVSLWRKSGVVSQ